MELYWYDIRRMDEAAYQAAHALLPPQRQQRVAAIANEDNRKRTVAAEWLARTELAKRLNMPAEAVLLTVDDDGKPFVEGDPLYCSISHSGAWAVCAISDKPVGVDLEVIRGTQEKYMQRICTSEELHYIRYGDEGCFARFFECWTAKEALFKLTGQGPLLALSRFALPENVALDHTLQNGCAVTVAMYL